MRFLVLVKATEASEAGKMPTPDELSNMGAFNDELAKAGILLDANGLEASSRGVRVTFSGGKPSITDGPFAETKELVAGYWVWQCKSKEEAVEWLSRAPFCDAVIDIRRMFELEEFLPAAAQGADATGKQ